jgi:1-deoxy-D-xylulose-5-phosphate reductoisomerase
MKCLSLLGSTGSIGTQTLEVVENTKDFKISALAAGSNIELLEQQIRKFKPSLAVVFREDKAKELANNIKDTDTKVLSGMEGLLEAVRLPEVDMVVTAVVGMIGILPTLEAIEAGKDIALANKETLVTAGHIIMPLAEKHQVSILPVDSEHSAIFQCLHGENAKTVDKLLLTASGGPFRGKDTEFLSKVTLADALKHPNWSMGRKITIDSATMVNKGLEVMEAKWLFGVDIDDIQVVVQPQSVIHSMVQFQDGAVLAQLGTPDMRLPIQYALFYPDRKYLAGERLDFATLSSIQFSVPEMDVFRGLGMAYQVGREGGSLPTVFNAANEFAVAQFLNENIRFLDIYDMIEAAINEHKKISNPSVEEILETEQWTYEFIESRWKIEYSH